jgi:DNA-binding XRE family transcriptional regulator
VHYQTVGYLERGEYSPSLYLALRTAVYFEVQVEVIFATAPFPRLVLQQQIEISGSAGVMGFPGGGLVAASPA